MLKLIKQYFGLTFQKSKTSQTLSSIKGAFLENTKQITKSTFANFYLSKRDQRSKIS